MKQLTRLAVQKIQHLIEQETEFTLATMNVNKAYEDLISKIQTEQGACLQLIYAFQICLVTAKRLYATLDNLQVATHEAEAWKVEEYTALIRNRKTSYEKMLAQESRIRQQMVAANDYYLTPHPQVNPQLWNYKNKKIVNQLSTELKILEKCE